MAVKLDIFANVKGTSKVNSLNRSVDKLGREATVAATRMRSLEGAALKGRASFSALATTLKVGVVAGFAAATFAAGSFIKSTISVGNLMEKSRIQFNAFFGDVKKGGEAFDILNEFAGKVPFTLDEIIQGGTALAAISDGPKELGKNLKIVGNLAATANLSFQDAALQYQRVASAGVAAADLLRDKGVNGLLGFEAGVRYSVEESVRVFEENFGPGGRFGKTTSELAKTLAGNTSLVQDAMIRFKAAAAVPLFEGLSAQVKELIGDFQKNDEKLKEFAFEIGTKLAEAFKTLGNGVRFMVENFNKFVTVAKLIIGLKVSGTFINMGIAISQFAIGLKSATAGMNAFNIAMRANLIGVIITGLQVAVGLWFAFGDAIKEAVIKKLNRAIAAFLKFEISFLSLMNKLSSKIGLNVDTTKLDEAKNKLKEINEEYFELSGAAERSSTNQNGLIDGMIENNKRNEKSIEKVVEVAEKASEKVVSISEAFSKGVNSSMKEAMDTTKNYEQLGKNVFDNMTDAIAKFVQTGKLNFKDLANDFIGQVIRMETKALASKAIKALSGMSFGSGPGAGMSGSFGMGGSGSKLGTLFSMGKSFLGFNKGGIVPGGAPYTDRVPAMLTPGEVVIPRDKVNSAGASKGTNITNINISGNVDQRSIDQIKSIISSSPSEVGGANKSYDRNTAGLRNRKR
jgi:hypothetical protein